MHASQSEPHTTTSVAVRALTTVDHFHRCVEIEEAVWNFDPGDSVPQQILVVAHETGGQVFGAFDGDQMVGFALAFPAFRNRHVHLHSHMAAVLPSYQGHGVGRMLKLAQRDEALTRGIDLIEWTFDPLQPGNANFNINRLGVVVHRYIPNFYGTSSSPLHAGIPTDRLVAEWHLNSARVQAIVAGRPATPPPDAARISWPKAMNALRRDGPAQAAEIQARVRQEFLQKFEDGYTVTGFSADDEQAHYLLEKHHAD